MAWYIIGIVIGSWKACVQGEKARERVGVAYPLAGLGKMIFIQGFHALEQVHYKRM